MRRVLCSSARRFGVRGLPRRTRVHEVAPRDGLQNETTVLSTPAKLSLIRQLVASGPSSVEVTSFVRADVIPALADADEVCAQLWQQEWAHDARSGGMEFVGLVLNKHGFDRFLRAQLDAVTLVVSCTDTHSKANSGKGFDDALVAMFDLVRMAHAEGVKVRTYASMAFGCPFEGDVEEARVRAVVTAMAEAGADTVVLADTIGTGHPEQARALAELALEIVPAERLGMHMHDTYGRAVDNAPSVFVCTWTRPSAAAAAAPSRRAPPATSRRTIFSRCSTTPAWRTASTARGSSTRTPPSRRRSAER